jgi:predicted dehydrogenase
MKVGVIGFGLRVSHMWNTVKKFDLGAELHAICDLRCDEIKKKLEEEGYSTEKIKFYDDADEMLDSEKLDGVMIGTRCSLHVKMASKVISRKIPLFLEKPVATNIDDLNLLQKVYEEHRTPVVVSFPLRTTPMVKLVKEIIDSGDVGEIEHVQAYNNVPYGSVYYQHWYRDENETGGLFLQKATHDFDYINYLLGKKPIKICAMKSKQIFKGDKPAGLACKDCSEYETCPNSPFYLKHFAYDGVNGDKCAFAVDTGNEDSGSAIIRYETGMHVNYSQNFFARKEARKRGATLFGYKGTIEFDWYKDEVKVYMHHTPLTRSYKFDSSVMAHFGGDTALAYNFINVMRGREKSIAPMEAGILSALMCIRAKESSLKDEFVNI